LEHVKVHGDKVTEGCYFSLLTKVATSH